jgi:hypothetical protein
MRTIPHPVVPLRSSRIKYRYQALFSTVFFLDAAPGRRLGSGQTVRPHRESPPDDRIAAGTAFSINELCRPRLFFLRNLRLFN